MRIVGAEIITPTGLVARDLVCADERIVALVEPGAAADDETLDAAGCWLLPGGVDVHTHFGMPLAGGLCSLGWRESSEAALLGGTTTVVDFANPAPGETLAAAVARWRRAADGVCRCDYGLHVTVSDASPARLAEIPALVAAGLPTFKGFLAYKGRLMLSEPELERLMGAVRAAGGLLLVHAEDGELNAAAEQVLRDTGRSGAPFHPLAHPPESEERAVAAALAMARRTGCPLTLVHLSLARSLESLRDARAAGHPAPLWGEVCLHHLLADDGLYRGGHTAALAAICSPPLRPAADGEALRAGLAAGELDFLSTDHCEFPLPVKAAAAANGFWSVPNGCGGVGERLVLSFSRMVASGRLDPARWLDALCTRPARAMGLGHRKGRLEPGLDADLVVFDPRPEYRWEPLGDSDRAGSLWAGMPVRGRVRDVFRRGRRVVADGRLVPDAGPGYFVERHLDPAKDAQR